MVMCVTTNIWLLSYSLSNSFEGSSNNWIISSSHLEILHRKQQSEQQNSVRLLHDTMWLDTTLLLGRTGISPQQGMSMKWTRNVYICIQLNNNNNNY